MIQKTCNTSKMHPVKYSHLLELEDRWLSKQLLADTTTCKQYELFSVVHHVGARLSGGHYVCDVRKPDGQWMLHKNLQWCKADDSSVKYAGHKEVLSRNTSAYILFYRAISLE